MRYDDKIDLMNKLDQIDRNNQAMHSSNNSSVGTGLPFLSGRTVLKIIIGAGLLAFTLRFIVVPILF